MLFLNRFSDVRPERFFLITAACFGFIFLLFTPPFQVPDEMNHFYKAYQISEGKLISVKENNRVGGTVPSSLRDITQQFVVMCWNKDMHTKRDTILHALKQPLQPEKKEFIDFPNTAVYSPVCYLPQAVGIFILRLFHGSALGLFYGARFFALLFWLIVTYQAIRIVPLYKWLFAFAALLPMSVFINMSLSADVVTNAVSLLCLAFILKLAYHHEPITQKQFIMLCVLCFLQVSVKLVYTPVLLAGLIIPRRHFKNSRDYVLKLSLLLAVMVMTALSWSALMKHLYTPYEYYNPEFRDGITLIKDADMYKQMDYIKAHGTYIITVFKNSLKEAYNMYSHSYIGTFGWLDTPLPDWMMRSLYALLLVLMISDGGTVNVKWWHRALFFAGFLLAGAGMLLSQHLTWDVVGGDTIYTIQGRYLIPFMPLLFLIFYNRIQLKNLVVPITIVSSVLSLGYSSFILYGRYFGF